MRTSINLRRHKHLPSFGHLCDLGPTVLTYVLNILNVQLYWTYVVARCLMIIIFQYTDDNITINVEIYLDRTDQDALIDDD